MIYLYTLILALIRGFAGLLPVSSSGHIFVLTEIFPSLKKYMDADVFFIAGMVIAVCIVYYKTIINIADGYLTTVCELFSGRFRYKKADRYQKMGIYLIVSSLPLIAVYFLKTFIDTKLSGLMATGICFLISAAFMFIADHSAESDRDISDMSAVQAVKIGMFQISGALTGISRQGAAMTSAINMGFTRKSALEFTFILSLPALIGNVIFSAQGCALSLSSAGVYLLAVCVSAAAGVLAIKTVQFLADRDYLVVFTVYCALCGIATIIFNFVR